MNFIETEELKFSYISDDGEISHEVLKGLDLQIKQGEFVAVVGRNGSGKSTLAKHFNALLLPGSGTVRVGGMDTGNELCLWDIRSLCGMVFQNPDNQLVSSIVEDDVAFGPENLGVEPSEIRRRVDKALKDVDMYEHRGKGPHLLSGGQKQRVAIAGVLAMRPECIVFDEPTAMLDPRGRADVMDRIKKIHKAGNTVILITHFMEEAAEAERIIVMDSGKIALSGSPEEIFSKGDILFELHIELPFAAELARRLRRRGVAVPGNIFREDELAAYLGSLI